MQIVNTGTTYKVYDSSLRTYDQLPAQNYIVNFNPLEGFSLSLYDKIDINEKVYGVHLNKVNKVVKSFKDFSRNLGIILSGDKGIGKSLFAKMLSHRMVQEGYPVIIVSGYIPGIAEYLANIQQEVVVLFDEFDKSFSQGDAQTEMLTLFDGLAQGKKMFVITCNEIYRLNEYLVNRPGRFHYHFRFDYPKGEEIREYLEDKLPPEYYGEIVDVISFAEKVKLNYDCLRAIAFELALGASFKEAISDLNIINIQDENYDITVVFADGSFAVHKNYSMDMFRPHKERVSFMYEGKERERFDIVIDPSVACWSSEVQCNIIKNNAEAPVKPDWYREHWDLSSDPDAEETKDYNENEKMLKELNSKIINYITIRRNFGDSIRYYN